MNHLFRHTVNILGFSSTQEASGTFTPSYTTKSSSVLCLLQESSAGEAIEHGKITKQKTLTMFCDISNSITETDRIEVSSGSFAGTYEILSIADAGGQGHHWEITLKL